VLTACALLAALIAIAAMVFMYRKFSKNQKEKSPYDVGESPQDVDDAPGRKRFFFTRGMANPAAMPYSTPDHRFSMGEQSMPDIGYGSGGSSGDTKDSRLSTSGITIPRPQLR
jgi:hypothetical protein